MQKCRFEGHDGYFMTNEERDELIYLFRRNSEVVQEIKSKWNKLMEGKQ